MVTVTNINFPDSNGRLGNQLFQLFSGLSYAKKWNEKFVLDKPWWFNPYLKNPIEVNESFDYDILVDSNNEKFEEIPYHKNISLGVYFQSYKFFIDIEQDLKEIILPNDAIKKFVDIIFWEYEWKNTCAIHVRRTDYKNFPNHHPILPIEYYKDAISLMDSDKYLIFSDDMNWCRDNFNEQNFDKKISDKFCFIHNDVVQDFFTMIQCDNFIVANSSLSWIAAFLGKNKDKKVVCPNDKYKWFGNMIKYNMEDLLLPNWIKL